MSQASARNSFAVVTAAACLSVCAPSTRAADANATTQGTGEDSGIAEIIVTARRTEESLQSTPVAVTALTSESLERAQVDDLYAVQYSAPNLLIGQNGANFGTTISLRGQVQPNGELSLDQSVGLYVDGVYIARQAGGLMGLVDVNRVEVLRGPQGTLFGRNTTGGAVNIVSNEPNGEFNGSLKLRGGNYDTREITGVVNLPIKGDAVAARLVAQHSEHSGYGRNLNLGRDAADDDTDFVRGSFKIAPDGAPWKLLLAGDYTDKDGRGQLLHLTAINPSSLLNLFAPMQDYIDAPFYSTSSDLLGDDRLKAWGGSATLTVDLGEMTFKSISAKRGYKHHNVSDFDASPVPFFSNVLDQRQDQFSQELQLFGKAGPLNWIGGLFYFEEDGTDDLLNSGVVSFQGDIKNKSYAPYVQTNYNFTDQLRATAGLRYTKDKRDVTAANTMAGTCLILPTLLDDGQTCRASLDASFDYMSYTAGLDYQWTPNVFVYGRTSMAHKAGGINKVTIPTLSPFAPEKVTDYEIGVKSDLFNRHLRINAAIFIADYENMQRSVDVAVDGITAVVVQAVGKARIPGAELEITALPLNGLELTASLGLLDPKYKEFRDDTGDRSHEPFSNVSKTTWSVGSTYSLPVPYGIYSVHADYSHQSAKYFFPSEVAREPGYGLLNAQATLTFNHPDLELAVWGRNLTKEQYNAFLLDFYASGTPGTVTGFRGDPRTYGMSLTYRF